MDYLGIQAIKNAYVDKIKDLLMLLEKEKRYEEMEQYALNAIRIESYDEKIHCYLVKAFTKQGNNTAAIAHYNKATKILLIKTIEIAKYIEFAEKL